MADRFLLQSGSGIIELQSSTDDLILQSNGGASAALDDGGDSFWGGFQSAIVTGAVIAAMALSVGNARAAASPHQDEYPYATGNGIIYGQPYTSRAQVKPVFIQMGTGDELPISAAPNFVDDTTPPVFSPKIEIPLPAPVWDDPQLCRILVEENEWGNPFVVPQIVVAPTFGHHDELGTTPAAPILEESEYLWPSILPTPFTGLWNSQDERPTPVITFPPSEEDWSFQNLSKDSIDGIIWVTDDDIAPAFAAEEIGWKAEWLIPKPFTEVLWTTDEIPTAAAQPQGGGGVVYDEISIFRWYQEDPLPVTATPLGIDEEPWKTPWVVLEPAKWLDSPDELIVPQPTPLAAEDDTWLAHSTLNRAASPEVIVWVTDDEYLPFPEENEQWPLTEQVFPGPRFTGVFSAQDEVLPSVRDEEPWIGPSYPAGPFTGTFSANDDIVPQPPTEINVEETYWIQPDPPRDVVTSWQFQTDVNEDFPELSEPPVIPEEPRVINLAPGWPLRFLVYINGKPHYGTQEEIDELLEELAEKDAEKPKKTRTRIVVQQGKPIFEKVPAPNKTQLLQFQSNFRDHYLKAYAKYKLEEDDEDDWLLLL